MPVPRQGKPRKYVGKAVPNPTADGKSRSARNADRGGEWRKLREMVKTLNQAMREHRRFELRSLRQFTSSGNSLGLFKREKSALFQRHLLNGLGTVPAARGPSSVSLRPV